MNDQPKITVGISEGQTRVTGRLNGDFGGDGSLPMSGQFSARQEAGQIVLTDQARGDIFRSPQIRLKACEGSTFSLFNVTVGSQFHWERTEDQMFQGDLIFQLGKDGRIVVINEIPLEDYLKSVVSSEMNADAPMEFLKAHAVSSRSWFLAALSRKTKMKEKSPRTEEISEGEVTRWYEGEQHDLFDVCAGDHCQRYEGTKAVGSRAKEAVEQTGGTVITYDGKICDARYSKACGGITEEFATAWSHRRVPYLGSISDASRFHPPIATEEEAARWILSRPEAYCDTKDGALLEKILSRSDRETKDFFRWKVEYSQEELGEILRQKSGFDFGLLQEIIPLQRGPSGRIFKLKIVGSKRSVVVGKELEIRRWLSRTHLYSSAFVVTKLDPRERSKRFAFDGAGWGHGVGLCQIGAAVMASRGFSAQEILTHYFRGVELRKIY